MRAGSPRIPALPDRSARVGRVHPGTEAGVGSACWKDIHLEESKSQDRSLRAKTDIKNSYLPHQAAAEQHRDLLMTRARKHRNNDAHRFPLFSRRWRFSIRVQ